MNYQEKVQALHQRHDPSQPGNLSTATATAGIARTKDLKTWERLPDLKTKSQQRNVVLHPEFVDGKYALYTRPQDGFIDTGSGGVIAKPGGFFLVPEGNKKLVAKNRQK